MNLLILAALVAWTPQTTFQVQAERVTNGLVITAPKLSSGEKYGSVLIFDGTSQSEPTPLASNLWLSDLPGNSGEFYAIICTDYNCTPVESDWQTDGTVHNTVIPTQRPWGERVAVTTMLVALLLLAIIVVVFISSREVRRG